MAAAEAAYETALKRLAAATRVAAQNPSDPTVVSDRQLADEALNASRTRVASARVALDNIRLSELLTFETTDALLGSVAGNQVLSLFPVGVEARLEPGRLRVRVWPDAISTSTHDPRLTEQELAATKEYWRAQAAATDEETSRAAWRALCEAIGVTRAAWAAQILTPTNRDALGSGVAPVFPIVAMQDEAAPFVARAAVMPDRWIAIGIREDGARIVEHLGAPIPMDLSVGLDTTPSETAALANREGEPIQLPPRMRWMTDFATAVGVGMALDIPLAADIDHIHELLVVGLRLTQSPSQNADALAGLFTGHRFSRGFAFVPQNTPTNNSVAGGSGLPSRTERIEAAFSLERRPRAFTPGLAANGTTAARAFGVAAEVFAPLPASGATAAVANEPDGFEPEMAAAMQTALWQITIGPGLEDFIALPESRVDIVRDFFRAHVRAAGPVPAMRVGRQPYGVLPVTTLNGFTAAGHEGIDPQLVPLLRAARTWFAMFRQSVFEGSSHEVLLHLGRSTQLFAETTQQNASNNSPNRWTTLAGSLARSTRNLFPDNWRNARITGTIDGTPLPITRAIVDDTTAAECAALAAALPSVLLSRPLHSSVLGRMARQATLLEWTRLAKAVCLAASLDEASTLDLDRREARLGGQIYIEVLVRAFTDTTPGPAAEPIDRDVVIDRTVARPPRTAAPRPAIPPALARRRDDIDPFPDEPDEPTDPDGPTRPRPEGDIAVNASELQRIRTLVGNLSQPVASCPGAARLASFRQALSQLSTYPARRLESELFGTLDICNHRIDAWFTGLAARRLETLRAARPTGIVIGGWGCLQDVRRVDPRNPPAEFIHTPSLDHAAAVAVLRSGARRAHGANSHHADIDLSSRRVRLARWILEGIRNGRSLNELLGVRFERAVKGTPAETALVELRTLFPALSGMGVLDGLALQQTGLPGSSSPDAARGVAVLNEALDAVADALTAEAVFQIVKGNPVGALIDVESIAAGASPPDLRVVETPSTGIRLTHRLVIAVPAAAAAPGWEARVSPRSRAEPILDTWCGLLLGPADNIVLSVESGAALVSVRLSSLRMAAIDIVLDGRNDGEELASLIVREASAASPLNGARVRKDRVWRDLVGLCESAARVLTRGEPLRSDAFDPPSAMTTATAENLGDLSARVAAAFAELSAVHDELIARTDPIGTTLRAAGFGIHVPGVVLGSSASDEQQDALMNVIETRLAGASIGTPRERLRALFGGDLPGLVAFMPRDPEALVTAVAAPTNSLLDGNLDAPRTWLEATGRTRPKAAALADILLRREIAGDNGSTNLLIAQSPWTDGDRWIATSFTSASTRPPSGRFSALILAPAGFSTTQPVGGLLIDAWTETIPSPSRDTAMALRFNNASTRAPQAILLAVSPNPAVAWSTTTLVDVLRETLMLARLRVQPPTTFSRGGLMPFAWLGQRPGNAGISFSL
ncbi:MAG TPA: hypothetical protein VKA59_11115 [Vicinamibacterales bacterium]|nr:hypothetical protein [Vicinamibacterales bacterium]